MKNPALFLLALTALLPTPAHAEASAREMLDIFDKDEGGVGKPIVYTGFYMAYAGFMWSNAALKLRNEKLLFCAPRELAVEKEQVTSIVRRYVARHPEQTDAPAGLIVYFSMVEMFPCGSSD